MSNGFKEFGLESYPGFDIDSSIVSKPGENEPANHDLAADDESVYKASSHDIITVKLLENGVLTTAMEISSSEELSSTVEPSSTMAASSTSEPYLTTEPNSTGTNAFNESKRNSFKINAGILMALVGSMNEDDLWSSSSFSVETGMSEVMFKKSIL